MIYFKNKQWKYGKIFSVAPKYFAAVVPLQIMTREYKTIKSSSSGLCPASTDDVSGCLFFYWSV